MIILPYHDIVLIVPPKCGSTSLHTCLCDRLKLGFLCISNDHDKHTFKVPFHYRDFKVFVVIRNPRERFISLYKHYCRWQGDVTYENYVARWRDLDWFYSKTIEQFLLESELKSYGFLKLEQIEDELDLIGLKVRIPKLHVADNKVPQNLIVPDSWLSLEGTKHEYPGSFE